MTSLICSCAPGSGPDDGGDLTRWEVDGLVALLEVCCSCGAWFQKLGWFTSLSSNSPLPRKTTHAHEHYYKQVPVGFRKFWLPIQQWAVPVAAASFANWFVKFPGLRTLTEQCVSYGIRR